MKSSSSKNHSNRLQGILDKLTSDEARLISEIICQDPFTGLYKKVIIIYAISLFLILLWPFDFTFIGKKNQVKWDDAFPGIEFTGEGQIISNSFLIPLYDSMVKGRGFSLEVWICPANNQQKGPARIVSYSLNPNYRNFTLGQQGQDLIMRLRTEKTNLNATEPMLTARDVFTNPKPLHIVVSYNFQEQKVYVNGDLLITSDIPGGDFKNWDPECRLVLGNEATGDRPWLGTLSYVAIYSYPLDTQEVHRSYNEVRNWISGTVKMGTPSNGLVVRYLLNEKKGASVTNSGTLVEPLNLHIPNQIKTESKPFLRFSLDRFPAWGSQLFNEIILNVLLFIPLAFLLHAVLATQMVGNWRTLFTVVAAGGAITLSVEILQYFSQSRHSSLVDVLANLVGVLLGVKLRLFFDSSLKRHTKIIRNALE